MGKRESMEPKFLLNVLIPFTNRAWANRRGSQYPSAILVLIPFTNRAWANFDVLSSRIAGPVLIPFTNRAWANIIMLIKSSILAAS